MNTYSKTKRRRELAREAPGSSASLQAVCHGLRLLREARGLTQNEIGQLASVPPASVSRYERALVLPNLETLHRILQALGVGLEELARASEEVEAAREEDRRPDPLLLTDPDAVDEDRVLAFFMSRVQSGRGMEYIEHLESWASRLRNVREFVRAYAEREQETDAESGEPGD